MTKAEDVFNPFPGLRPFVFNDEKYYFGRDGQVKKVIEKVLTQRFVALIGSSGSGKSSLINAGIIPGICAGSKNQTDSSWRVITSKPGTSPIDNLAKSLTKSGFVNNLISNNESPPEEIAKILRNSPNGVIEALRKTKKDREEKVLLVIDQFEDLFRFKRSRNNRTIIHEYDNFIKLIVEAKKQTAYPVYILLAVRSDFIEEFHQFQELTQLINSSNYFLPGMTSDDLKEVINRPAELGGAQIDPYLEQQLLNDIRDEPDQLPLLQHLLHRIWEHWIGQNNNDRPISLEDYEATGGIEYAISNHLEEPFKELSDSGRIICERMFKVLTEKGTTNHEITNPARIADIATITRVRVSDIIEIVERFRQPGRSFMIPYHDVELTSDTIIDLTHESLIRLWPRLRRWVDEEADSITMYKRLAEASRLYQMGKAQLWTSPDLQQAMQWYEKNEPSFQWAQRYNTAFERTIQFLKKSKETYDLKDSEDKERPYKLLSYTRIFAASMILLIVVSVYMLFNLSGSLSETREQLRMVLQGEISTDGQLAILEKMNEPANALKEPEQSYPANQNRQAAPTQNNQVSQAVPAQRNLSNQPPPVQTREATVTQGQSETRNRNILEQVAPNYNQVVEIPTETSPPDIEPTILAPEPARQSAPVRSQPEPVAVDAATRSRMTAISQSLAVRSLQVEGDPNLKALLALQSHIFNKQYDGQPYNPDIFAGLLTSVKTLYGNSYNVHKGHSESVNSVVFRQNSSVFYSASSDGKVLQWDINDETKTPRLLIQIPVANNLIALSPNGQWLAIATDGQGIQVLNPTRNLPSTFQIPWGNNRIIALDFYPDNEHIVFAGSDNALVKYNVRNNTNQVIAKTESEILSLSVSPDGKTIAAGTRAGQVLLFREAATPARQIIHHEQGNDVLTVKFNRNGSRIAAGSLRGEVRILELATGNLLATLRGHSARVVDVEFCPANRLIATSSFDGTIHLWSAQNLNTRPVVLRDHGSWVRTVAFNSSGDTMISGSRQESRLLSYKTDFNEMALMICEKVTRSMTREEWNQFVGDDIPYMDSCRQLSDR